MCGNGDGKVAPSRRVAAAGRAACLAWNKETAVSSMTLFMCVWLSLVVRVAGLRCCMSGGRQRPCCIGACLCQCWHCRTTSWLSRHRRSRCALFWLY